MYRLLPLCILAILLLLSCSMRAANVPPGGNNTPPAANYDPQPADFDWQPGRNTLMVEVSDGTNLATDVYLPAGEGPWPVMLIRTPYGKDAEEAYGLEVSQKGFALVAQDARGRFASEGENIPLIGSDLGPHNDGYETIAWIMVQPWCNGKIGSLGGSALGMTQLYTAPGRPTGLACQFIGVAPASMYHEFVYHGGAFREEQMVGWIDSSSFDPVSLELYRQHPTYDEWWHKFSMVESAGEVVTPGMHFGGWFDTFSQGTINTFLLRQHQGGEGARGRQGLVMGPWTHGGVGSTECGEIEFPEIAKQVPDNPYDSLMDYYLKDIDTGLLERPAVTYYVMGDVDDPAAPGNIWRMVEDWPPPATKTSYYLHADGSLNTSVPAGSETSNWTFDPADPPPTLGGRNLIIDKGIYDQRPAEERDDVLVFETPELDKALEVTGRVICRFWVSCDQVDTDVAVRLCDVYPDGRSLLIADGILRLRYRDSMIQTALLTPGQVYEVEVDLWSTSIIFAPGHRLRISVAGGNHPRWDVNPGTGELWEAGGATVVQHTTLYHSPDRPSALVLPVME